MTMQLHQSLAAWGSPAFAAVLKQELERQAPGQLPLQQGLSSSSAVLDTGFSVMVLGAEASIETIRVRLGVFFSGIVAGCSCADDPTPVEAQNEYCELELSIDRATAAASAVLAE